MNNTKNERKKPLGVNSPMEAFQLDLQRRTTFQGTNIIGCPADGTDPMNLGLMPEPYWTAAADAVYWVRHYETPIVWLTESGTWQVPIHSYSNRTTTLRNKLVAAIRENGEPVEEI